MVGQILRIRHHQMAADEEVLHPNDRERQKEVVTRKAHIRRQPRQLSCQEKPWVPSKRLAEIASQVGQVLRTEHRLWAKRGAWACSPRTQGTSAA